MSEPDQNATNVQIAAFLTRRDEVAKSDHDVLNDYLRDKQAAAVASADNAPPAEKPAEKNSGGISRRGVLLAGTVIAAEAGVLAYATAQDTASGAGLVEEPQREAISRELIDYQGGVGGQSLGKWIALLPTKLGGGTYALDLNTNRVLASIWYWNYGDFNPISHHLCAFPSADPYRGFEFVNATQGGKNCLIFGIPTRITEPAPGFNIYRVRYDGAQMQMVENVSESTGLGLGVHVTINPKDAQSYFVTDGQKDIAACFDRATSEVKAALKFDWKPNSSVLARAWQDGGVLTISRIYPDKATGKFDYEGTKGLKIEWEMVPMGELFVEEGTLPGADPISSPLPSCSSTRARPASMRWSRSMTITGPSPSTRSILPVTRSVFLRMAASCA